MSATDHPGMATARAPEPAANRIDRLFAGLAGRTPPAGALILYVTAGHPDFETSLRLASTVARLADAVEIGIPFSDPVADGPIIQRSTQAALRNGATLGDCFAIARAVRQSTHTPIVFLTYYNPVLHHGLQRFAAGSREAGVDGVICADLPPEEAGPLHQALTAEGICLIPMIAPTSTDDRIRDACRIGSGFVYCVSRTGVTGLQEALDSDLPDFLARVKRNTDLPRAVGFGVSTARQAHLVSRLAEGVIIGSALVDLIAETPPDKTESAVQAFVETIRDGISKPGK